ncbi:hypothetical protein DFS33DRAFT_1109369 [Desarmillaria ectypa]|nr:hypothetical protein DFS33DRAFT_1109369 [Desarmillaria ectypa]
MHGKLKPSCIALLRSDHCGSNTNDHRCITYISMLFLPSAGHPSTIMKLAFVLLVPVALVAAQTYTIEPITSSDGATSTLSGLPTPSTILNPLPSTTFTIPISISSSESGSSSFTESTVLSSSLSNSTTLSTSIKTTSLSTPSTTFSQSSSITRPSASSTSRSATSSTSRAAISTSASPSPSNAAVGNGYNGLLSGVLGIALAALAI